MQRYSIGLYENYDNWYARTMDIDVHSANLPCWRLLSGNWKQRTWIYNLIKLANMHVVIVVYNSMYTVHITTKLRIVEVFLNAYPSIGLHFRGKLFVFSKFKAKGCLLNSNDSLCWIFLQAWLCRGIRICWQYVSWDFFGRVLLKCSGYNAYNLKSFLCCQGCVYDFFVNPVPALRGKDYGKSKMRYPDFTVTESGLQYKVKKEMLIYLFINSSLDLFSYFVARCPAFWCILYMFV